MQKTILLAVGILLVFLWVGQRIGGPQPLDAGTVPGDGNLEGRSVHVGRGFAGVVREVTAYNVGDTRQTSDDPCIGAMGVDLCRLIERGWKVCAANFVELGTILKIEKYGECYVLDRLHRRHTQRVDIAMGKDEVDKALEFGLQRRVVEAAYHRSP
jgi:3D (Asp-Asp-Asp) domain-containing protein